MYSAKSVRLSVKHSLAAVLISLFSSLVVVIAPAQAAMPSHVMGASCRPSCTSSTDQPAAAMTAATGHCATNCLSPLPQSLVTTPDKAAALKAQPVPDPFNPTDLPYYLASELPPTPQCIAASTGDLITTFRPPDKVRLNYTFRF